MVHWKQVHLTEVFLRGQKHIFRRGNGNKSQSQISTWMRWFVQTKLIVLINQLVDNIRLDMVQIIKVKQS